MSGIMGRGGIDTSIPAHACSAKRERSHSIIAWERSCRYGLFDRDRLHDIAGTDAAHDIHAGDGVSKNGVFGRQVGLVLQADEELAAVGVGTRVGHRDGAGSIGPPNRLVVKSVAGTTATGAGGVAALNHKTWLDAVKDNSIIKTIAGQGHE